MTTFISFALTALLAGPPAGNDGGGDPAPSGADSGPAAGGDADDGPAPGEAGANPGSGGDGESGGKVTRYSFSGLGIDGELRTPALLQFLSRIGGEFETAGIPHRSFMPELQRTVMEDSL